VLALCCQPICGPPRLRTDSDGGKNEPATIALKTLVFLAMALFCRSAKFHGSLLKYLVALETNAFVQAS
jgi:hypothetical protein